MKHKPMLTRAALAFVTLATVTTGRAEPQAATNAPPAVAVQPTPPREMPKVEWLDPNHGAPNGTQYQTFHSVVLGQDASYLVWLPAGYAQQTNRYPVIYWLHGHGGNQRAGASTYVPHVEAAIKAGVLPPVIVVCVNGMGRGHYLDQANGKLPIESVIIKDLVPHVDQSYRTLATREGRVIEGFSMGGFGAGHLGFKYPELFGTVVINSGALRDATWFDAAEHPKQLARKNVDQLRHRTRIRLGCGALDDLLPANQELHEVLQQLGLEHPFVIVPDVPHNSALYYEKLGTQFFEFHRKSLEAFDKAGP